MIEVTYYDGHTMASKHFEDVTMHEKNLVFNVTAPTREELLNISKTLDISILELDRAIDPNERPTIEQNDHYYRITLSTPKVRDSKTSTMSISFFIKEKFLLILNKTQPAFFKDFKNHPKTGFDEAYSKDISNILYYYLSHSVGEFFYVLDEVEEGINHVEERLFKHFDDKHVLKLIFGYRRTMIYFHKSLAANREVFQIIDKEFVEYIKKSDIKKYKNTYFDILQLIDMVGTYREILTGTIDIYMTSISNNLNEVIKRLTVYASYVLVPTLISGIYGMNFMWMPEIAWQYGYFFALGLMVFSVMSIRLFFKRKGWI
ncbi:magnesium transporter CorA family protein [Candidatus Woesearchaeota archaeon]|nr:magnesium transporter CorA family protein [Candidatus Woesearchaeota archaeon]